jgi:hypothetical protein
MVGIDSAETAEQARFVIELYAIGALYLLACIAFLLRRSGWGWWLTFGMHVGVFVLALIEGVLLDWAGCSTAVDLVRAVRIPNGAGQAEAAR